MKEKCIKHKNIQGRKKHKKIHESKREEWPSFGKLCKAPNHVFISELKEIKTQNREEKNTS